MPNYVESKTIRYIKKSWNCEVCAFPEDPQVVSRLQNLTRLGKVLDPPISVFETTHTIRIAQQFIRRYRPIDRGRPSLTIDALVEKIKFFRSHKLVHGDLCFSNLGLCSNSRLLTFDWEPFLVMRTPTGQLELRSSKYSHHPIERGQQTLTIKSDMYALATLIPQIILGRYRGLSFVGKHSKIISQLSVETYDPSKLRNLVEGLISPPR